MTNPTTNRGRTFWLAKDDDGTGDIAFCSHKMTLSDRGIWCLPKREQFTSRICPLDQKIIPPDFHLAPGEQIHVRVTDNGWERID